MRFRIEPKQVEHKKIIIENEAEHDCLCRVDVNHRLFKIIYLKPKSVQKIIYDKEDNVLEINVTEIK